MLLSKGHNLRLKVKLGSIVFYASHCMSEGQSVLAHTQVESIDKKKKLAAARGCMYVSAPLPWLPA